MKTNLLTVASAFLLVGCEPKVKTEVKYVEVIKEVQVPAAVDPTAAATDAGADDGDGDTPPTTPPSTKQSVALSGTLALSLGSGSGGSNLRGFSLSSKRDVAATPTYSLNCVTLGGSDDVAAVKVPIAETNGTLKFSKELGDWGGRSLGCFLLKGDTVLTSVIFGGSSNLTPGAGDIVADISYDEDAKRATAKIDLSKSTALFPEAVAKAKTTAGTKDTNIAALTGTFNVTCVPQDGMPCDSQSVANSMPSTVYIATETKGDDSFATIWKDQTNHDQCVPPATTATESKPLFGMKFGSNTLQLDFRDSSSLNSSLDAFYGTLKNTSDTRLQKLFAAIESNTKSRTSWKDDYCSQTFTSTSNCKLFLAKMNSYTWIDYEGKEVTNSYVQWTDAAGYAEAEYSGTITSKYIPCSSYWTPDKDMCPPGTANDDGTGTVQGFFGTDANGAEQRLRLVCVRSGQSWPEYQQNALANNKTDAVTAASEAEGCTTITAAPFAGKRELYRTESRNVISEIASYGMYNNGQALCRHKSVPSGFTFKDCATLDTNQLNYMYWDAEKPSWITPEQDAMAQNQGYTWQRYDDADRGALEFCRNFGWSSVKNNFDINQTTGHLDKNANSYINGWEGEELCPTAFAAATTPYSPDPTACVNEFNAMNAGEQVSAMLRQRIGKWQPMVYAACSQSNATDLAFFEDANSKSCLPVAGMTYMCGSSGTCVASLRCYGTEKGKCYDGDVFIGRIPGRISAGVLDRGTEGAFSVTSSVKDSYVSWDDTNHKMQMVTLVNETVIQGALKEGEQDFEAYMKRKIKKTTSDLGAGEQGAAGAAGGGYGGAGNANQAGGQSANAAQIPEEDLMVKLNFDK